MAKKKQEQSAVIEIEIEGIATQEIEVCLLGTSALVLNRLGDKARRELLLPSGPKNAAQKASTLKHDPLKEYRASCYKSRDGSAPTRITHPGSAFSKAMASAALDLGGATRAQIGRLVRVVEADVPIYGVPKLWSTICRNLDKNRTPDVRTRARLEGWACRLVIRFPTPLLTEKGVMTLLAAAGDFVGIAEGRTEKGSGLGLGAFRLVAPDDPQFLRVLATGGRGAQDAALQDPEFFDDETADLVAWFDVEVQRRGRAPARGPRKGSAALSNGAAREGVAS